MDVTLRQLRAYIAVLEAASFSEAAKAMRLSQAALSGLIKELENLKVPAADRMQHFDAYMDPVTHQMQQTIYLARRNMKPADKTDLFEIISWTDPKTAEDDAAPTKCKLAPYDKVPAYEL